MNFRQKITFSLLLSTVLCLPLSAQKVEIPDPNLRAAIRKTLNLPDNAPLTRASMRQMVGLKAKDRQIENLTGIEHATALEWLVLANNEISDLRSLAALPQLDHINLRNNLIADISPLANLTTLTDLHLNHNEIFDISPLANLMGLTKLLLGENDIVDVAPLANLTSLKHLELQNNRVTDITPLDNLTNLEYLNTQNNPIFDANSPIVDIPDPNLRAAIRETLDLPDGVPVNRVFMQQLTGVDAGGRGISDLTGLEHASSLTFLALPHNNISDLRALTTLVNLTFMRIHHNQINNVSPLANLRKVTTLLLDANDITNISPLANLAQLTTLVLGNNNITDVSSLANLTNLKQLELERNLIADVSPLANLTNLVHLNLRTNEIADHSPINNLSLATLIYDETCDMPPLPLLPRLQNRTYPSIFAPFDANVNQPRLSWTERMAQHNLYFSGLFKHKFFDAGTHWEVRGSNERSIRIRDELIALNPNVLFLAEIRMRDEGAGYPPPDSPAWMWVHDHQGNLIYNDWRRLINFTHPKVQDMIVQQAIAVSKCGLVDGIIFDGWADTISALGDSIPVNVQLAARKNILQRIRATTRPDFLILVNTNDRIIPLTGPSINGGIMESTVFQDHTGERLEERLTRVENTLRWLEQNLREPRMNSLQGGSNPNEPPDSPINLRYMRAITTLSLTHSDGYVQFAIGSGNDHYWYDFWDTDLGRPVGPKSQLYDEDTPGLYIREFTNGWAVYNHSGAPQIITLPEEAQGVASGHMNTEHELPNLDGEMYLRAKPRNPADVNGDGVVNIFDLTLVAQAFGKDGLQGDVNGDGVVNVFDLVFVANQF